MRVLVLGNNAREHALAWKIAQSENLQKLYCAPGNPGTAEIAENLPCDIQNPDQVVELTLRYAIDLLVIGPEAPLAAGVADRVREQNPSCAVFGPSKAAARLEWSKAYAKSFMNRYSIPTAEHRTFDQPLQALAYLSSCQLPVVIKADGLAAGKGVIIAFTREEAEAAVSRLPASQSLVVEEYLIGREVSIFALTDGERYYLLEAAEDHKQLLDGDRGPNTGGMGAYSPVSYLTEELCEDVSHIVEQTLHGLRSEGAVYRGVIYLGLMLTPQGVKVLEYNARFGDPECQVLMCRLAGDVLPYLDGAARGQLPPAPPTWSKQAVALIVACGAEYPEKGSKHVPIFGLGRIKHQECVIFHAGTSLEDGQLVTSGGRILNVVGIGKDLPEALQHAYGGMESISFAGMHFRRDIGRRRGDFA